MPVRIHATSVRMPETLLNFIKIRARRQGCSIAFKINEILLEWRDRTQDAEKAQGKAPMDMESLQEHLGK